MTQPTSERVIDKPFSKPDATARRTRLREFQAQLVERMQAAKSGVHAQQKLLGVMIGQSRWLLNLHEAGEIVSVGTITKVPLTQDWFLGLTSIRGNLISVVDFARFQGMAPTPVEKESRIVAFAPSLAFNSGLLVSRVMGLRNVADMQPEAPVDPDATSWSVKRYRDSDAQVWSELDLSLLIKDPHFLHVGL